jgi:anti-sigma factor RsiW
MTPCDEQLLSAFADGELPAGDTARVEAHVRECAACAMNLARIRESSRLLREYPFEDLTGDELRLAHDAIDAAADRPVLRLGFTLGVIAASVLVVSCAWLIELRAPRRQARDTTMSVATSAQVPQWERMAMTLRADPLPHPNEDTTRFAGAQPAVEHADWMLTGLVKDN